MSRTFVIVGLLAGATACHGASTPARPIGNTAAAPVAAPDLFTGLFARDRALTYAGTIETSYWDDQDPAADANGNVNNEATGTVACTLTVGQLGQLRTATLTCAADEDVVTPRALEELARAFVTDGQRLWRLDAGVTVDDAEAVAAAIAAAPDLTLDQAPVDETEEDPEEGGRFGSTHVVMASGDGWCVQDNSWGGDEGGASWCLSAADGLVSASWFFGGGSTRDERLELRTGK